MRRLLAAALLALATGAGHAREISAKVIVVIDGDTVLALLRCAGLKPSAASEPLATGCVDGKPVKIRLADIDAPEKGQPGGAESALSLSGMVLKRRVSVAVRALDKYGRFVARLAAAGTDINAEQVRLGMAWEYSNYHSNRAYLALQREAREARRGLWARADPLPPWRWRKLHEAEVSGVLAKPVEPYRCGSKRYCAQMQSCAEARYYLERCGVISLDANDDGVPCESLCRKEIPSR